MTVIPANTEFLGELIRCAQAGDQPSVELLRIVLSTLITTGPRDEMFAAAEALHGRQLAKTRSNPITEFAV